MQLKNDVTEYVNLFKNREPKLIKEFYLKNYYKAEAFILRNSGSIVDCEDVYQDALIALWEKIETIEFNSINDIDGYFYRMVQYKWYDHLRRQKKKRQLQQNWMEWEQEIDEEKEEKLQLLEQQLNKLGEQCRNILEMFYYKKLSYEAMAKVLDFKADVLKTMKYRCIKKLKEKMKATPNSDE